MNFCLICSKIYLDYFFRGKVLHLIVNKTAGGKSGKKSKKTLFIVENRLKERNINYQVHATEYKGHATLLTRELIEKGANKIVVLGGDGTLHEVINGFHSFETACLGLIPCGTGNDFATAIGLPKDPVKAIDLIIDGEPKYTDFMQLPTVRGINVIGAGIDVDVLIAYNKLKHKNKFGYTWCLIKTLFNINFIKFTANVNGNTTKHNSFIAAIANGDRFGGGIPICPVANPTDKKLNFVSVEEIRGLKIIPALIKLMSGKVLTLKQASETPFEKISIDCEKPFTIDVDGELYQNVKFDVEIVSDKLKMYR